MNMAHNIALIIIGLRQGLRSGARFTKVRKFKIVRKYTFVT